MASWERLINTTITEHSREVVENTLRNHKFLAKLKAFGRITYGHAGAGNSTNEDMDWRVKFAQGTLSGLDDADTVSFERIQRYQIARLPWRGYSMQDSMTKKEKLQNANREAIINYFARMGDELLQDATEQLHDEFYIDGNATGNGKRFHGLESCLASAGGETATTQFATPSDTYAGLSTAPGNKGGNWTGTWPVGSGSPEYDYWAPKLGNWSANNWGTGSTSFDDNAEVVLRRMLIHTRASKSAKGDIDCIFLDRNLWAQFADLNNGRQQINVNRGTKSTSLVALGFLDVINFDGVDVTHEFSVPSNTGYGVNFNALELCLLNRNRQLFDVEGPNYDMERKAYLLSIDLFGNMKINPRSLFKIKNYA